MQRLKQFFQIVMYAFIFVILISSIYYFTTEKPRTLLTAFAIFGGESNYSNLNKAKIPDVDLMNRFGFLTGHENIIARNDGTFDLDLSSSPGVPGLIHLDQEPEAIIDINGLDLSEKYQNNATTKIEIKAAIDQLAEHNNHGNIKTVVFAIDSYPIKEATIILPKTGYVEYILRCDEFDFNDFDCNDDWKQTDIPFEDLGDTIKFTVDHFTAYAGGGDTETNRANLTIWDETDTGMLYADQSKYPQELVTFFANYSNNMGNVINGSGILCNITFIDGPANMNFNSTRNLYQYSRSFSSSGTFNYTLLCDGSLQGYVPLSVSDQVEISEVFDLGTLAVPSVSLATFLTTEPQNNQSFIVNTTATDADSDPFNLTHNYYINNQLLTLLNLPMTNKTVSASGDLTFDVSGKGNHFFIGNESASGDAAEPNYERSCHDGGCYNFDGVDDYLQSNGDINDTDFNLSQNFSIEFWINSSDTTGTIIGKRGQTFASGWEVRAETGNEIAFFFGDSNNNNPSVTSTTDPLTGDKWVHVVAVRDVGADQLLLYLNGTLAKTATDSTTGTTTNNKKVVLGNGTVDKNQGECCFQGMIDSLKIYNKSLSEAQILENYNNGVGKSNTTLAKETKIGERWNASVVAIDINGHNSTPVLTNNNVTVLQITNNAPTISSFSITGEPENDDNITANITKSDSDSDKVNVTYSWKVGSNYVTLLNLEFNDVIYTTDSEQVYDFTELQSNFILGSSGQGDPYEPSYVSNCHDGGCYVFDGAATGGDYIRSRGDIDNLDFNLNYNFSIELWVNSSDTTGTIIGKRGGTFASGWEVRAETGNEIAFFFGDSNNNNPSVTSTTDPLTGDKWVHVVAVRDVGADQLLLYLNGTLAKLATDSTTGTTNNSLPVLLGDGTVGSSQGECCFQGLVDSARIYNKSLSGKQILELYLAGVRGYHSNISTPSESQIREVWNATATAVDEHGLNSSMLGSTINATIQIPANNAPSITALNFNPATPNSTQNISTVPTQSDTNAGDTINTTYSWKINSTVFTLFNLPFNDVVYTTDSETLYDFTELGNHLTLGSSGQGDPFEPQNLTSCVVGSCYNFDGASTGGDYIRSHGDIDQLSFSNTSSFSIEFWVNSTDSDGTIIGKRGGNFSSGWEVRAELGNEIAFFFGDSDNNNPSVTSTTNPMNGAAWVHVVAVRDVSSDILRLYLNGSLAETANDITTKNTTTTKPVLLGDGTLESSQGECCFQGMVDQIKIYNRSLTVNQIYDNYLAGLSRHDINLTDHNETNPGDTWTVYAVPIDSRGFNGTNFTNSVSISENTAPTITVSVNETNATLTSLSDINGTANYTDSNGDTGTVYFTWFVNDTKNFTQTATSVTSNINVSRIFTQDNFSKGHTIILEATPNDGTVNGTAVNTSSLTVANIAPQIAVGVNETNTTLTTLSDINATANYTDQDADTGTVYFTLYRNDSKQLTLTRTTVTQNINVSHVFQEGNFSKGHTLIIEMTPSDGATNGTARNTSSLTVGNIAPQITVSLNETNTTLTTLSDINATTNYTDSDSDTGTVYFALYRNGTSLVTLTATSVSPNINVSRLFMEGNFSKGHTLIIEATPYDGATNGTAVNTSSLTVQNIAPRITVSVNETNATLTSLSDINATANYTDSDSDTGTVYFALYRNGTSLVTLTATSVSPNINVSRLFMEGNFSKGHTLIIEATPYDGVTNGTAVNTSSLTAGNSPPTITVSVNETNSTLTTLSDINGTANYTDGDSDTGTVYFTWFVNGTKNLTQTGTPSSNVSKIFREGNFSKGHTIILEATPYDNTINGTAVNTSSLTVGNVAPSVSILSTTSSLTSSQSLTTNASYTDPDNESGTIYFELFVNGISQLIQSTTVNHNRSNTSTFSPSNYAQGNKLIVQVHGQDSSGLNGTKINSSQVTVQAAPSNPPSGSPESGEPGDSPVEPPPECEPEWECGDLSKAPCIDGKQTVECSDGCGKTKEQSQACQINCQDSDGGMELTAQGTITGYNPWTNLPYTATDKCWNTGRILEHFCQGQKLTWNSFDCPKGTVCIDGACSSSFGTECSDSDTTNKVYDASLKEGKYFNPFSLGTVTVSDKGTGKSITYTDNCFYGKLIEFYCDANNKYGSKDYMCPKGTACNNGACVGETCESKYDPACETDFTQIACVNGLRTKECPDISDCKGPAEIVTQECLCEPKYDPACEIDFTNVECKDGQKIKSCSDISGCNGPAKQVSQYCGCVPDFGDCPNWEEATCKNGKLKITCQDINGCVEPVKYEKSCSVLEEEFVTEIPPEEQEGEIVDGTFVPYYGIKLQRVTQDGELVATNNKFVKDFVITDNQSSDIQIQIVNTGLKPLSDLKIVFDVPESSAKVGMSPVALPVLEPNKVGSFKATFQTTNVKKSFPVKLSIFTKETYVMYKFYGVVDKVWKYLDKDVVKRLFKRLLPAIFETVPVRVWWLLFFTLPLLLLLQNTHIIDENTLLGLTVTRHIDQFGRVYVHSPAYRRYSRMNNIKPLLVKSSDEHEIRELQKMYKLDEELSELIVASKRKYRPYLITSAEIPKQLKHKYLLIKFVNPLHTFPLYLIQSYIKKARFNGYKDLEIREELLKKGWEIREVDSCLGIAKGTEHQQVYEYVKEHVAKGFTLHDIRSQLLAHGWNDNVIKQCLKQRIMPVEPKINVLHKEIVKEVHTQIINAGLKQAVQAEMGKGIPQERIFAHLQKIGWHPEVIAKHIKLPITKTKLAHGLEVLSDYVSHEVSEGFELQDIKQRLLYKGWRIEMLDTLFKQRNITASSIVGNYIDKELLEGFSINEIRNKLVRRGWKYDFIDTIFAQKLEQPSQLIISYVDREMASGFDTIAIKKRLLRKGWKQDLVDQCLQYSLKKPYNTLLYYIQEALDQGYAIEDVQHKLFETGWNKKIVESSIKLRLDEASAKLLKYIDLELRVGVDILKIRYALLTAGWNKRIIDIFIKKRTLFASSLLVTYIDNELKAGYDLEVIKQCLLRKGWHKEIVEKCIDVVTKKPRLLIEAYIKRLIQEGQDLSIIKKRLLTKGWNKSFVSEVVDPKIKEGHRIILDYIDTMLKKGFVLEQIKTQLHNKGWRHEVVEDALYQELVRYYRVIDDYVAEQLASGHDTEDIRQQLITVGWKESLINLVFEERFSKKIEEVLKYVRGLKQAGISLQEIENRLLTKGWKKDIIQQLVKTL